MDKEKVTAIHKALAEDPALHARLVEVLAELNQKIGSFDGKELIEGVKIGKDLFKKHDTPSPGVKGLSSAGQEFNDHYMR